MKVLVDLFNVLHMSFNIAKTQAIKEKGTFTDDDVGLYYHKVLDAIVNITKTYGNVIFANEGRNSLQWRREIYPEYKKNRVHDDTYQIFKDNLNTVLELISWFPSKVITVDGAEADDVMYSLSTYFADNEEDVIVITSDRDMAQLLNYSDRISVFNPLSKTFRAKEPNIILEKAIVGDASDNISGIPRVGIKTFEKALVNKDIWNSKITPNMSIVEEFIKIIDLSKAPKYIKSEAIIQYNNSDYSKFDPQSIELFMYNNKLVEHLNRWNNDLNDINLALYSNSPEKTNENVKAAELDEIESMLNFINNL